MIGVPEKMINYNKFKLRIILLCCVGGVPVGMMLLYTLRLYTDIFNHKVWMEIAITYVIYIFLIIYIFVQLKNQNINLKRLGHSNEKIIPLTESIMALVIAIIISIMIAILVLCAIEIGGYSVEDTRFNTPSYNSTIIPIVLGIRTVMLTPILEEIMFRGIIYEKLRAGYGVRKALIFSSLLFGIFHIGVIPQIISGLIYGAWYIKTKSLRTSILVHMLNNFLTVTGALSFLLSRPLEMIGKIIQNKQSALCVIVVLVLSIIIIFYIVVRYIFINYKTDFQSEE